MKMPARARSCGVHRQHDRRRSSSIVPCGHLVVRVAHDGEAERALAGAVRAHQGVRFAAADREVHAAEDRLAFDGDVQIRDLQRFSHCINCHGFEFLVFEQQWRLHLVLTAINSRSLMSNSGDFDPRPRRSRCDAASAVRRRP